MNIVQAQNKLDDISQIRKDASQSMNQGAVTKDYSLALNQVLQYLNEALASELMCVLRYRHHQIVAKGINYPQVAAEFAEHAETEHEHAMRIAERIDQLGGEERF